MRVTPVKRLFNPEGSWLTSWELLSWSLVSWLFMVVWLIAQNWDWAYSLLCFPIWLVPLGRGKVVSMVSQNLLISIFFLFKNMYFIYFHVYSILPFMCTLFCQHAYPLTAYFLDVCGGHKGASCDLELELQMAASHYVGAGNWALVLWQNQCLKCWSIFLVQLWVFSVGIPAARLSSHCLILKALSSSHLPS